MEEILVLRQIRATLGMIPKEEIQRFVDNVHCLDMLKSEDGSGLKNGGLIDSLFREMVMRHTDASLVPKGQADVCIYDVPLSFKTGKGKTTFAVNWGKNKKITPVTINTHLLFLIRTSSCWCTGAYVHKGFYLIARDVARTFPLTSNNRSNTVMSSSVIYELIQWSVKHKLALYLPEAQKKMTFCLTNAFSPAV